MNEDLLCLCRQMAEWHAGDGDERGVVARRALELIEEAEGVTKLNGMIHKGWPVWAWAGDRKNGGWVE